MAPIAILIILLALGASAMRSGSALATTMIVIGMTISGTTGLFSVMSGQPTQNVVFFRCSFGIIALLAWILARGGLKNLLNVKKAQWHLILISGLCLVLNWLALFDAFGRTTIGFATIIYSLQPLWVVLAGSLILKEELPRHSIAWICVAFVGLTLTILPKLGEIRADTNWLIGAGFALTASIFYAGVTLISRSIRSVRPECLSTYHCLIGAIAFLPFLNVSALPVQGNFDAYGWLVGLGLIHTSLVYVLLYAAYPHLPTTLVAAAAFLNPAAALLCDYFVFERSLDLIQAAGLVLILLAGSAVSLGRSLIFRRAPTTLF